MPAAAISQIGQAVLAVGHTGAIPTDRPRRLADAPHPVFVRAFEYPQGYTGLHPPPPARAARLPGTRRRVGRDLHRHVGRDDADRGRDPAVARAPRVRARERVVAERLRRPGHPPRPAHRARNRARERVAARAHPGGRSPLHRLRPHRRGDLRRDHARSRSCCRRCHGRRRPCGSRASTASCCSRSRDALDADPADPTTVEQWARRLGLSPRHFSRLFKAETGVTFSTWRALHHVEHALVMLAAGHTVTRVAMDLGYASTSSFIEMFKRHTGRTPGTCGPRAPLR